MEKLSLADRMLIEAGFIPKKLADNKKPKDEPEKK